MKIKVYGAKWCSDCVVVKNFFNSRDVEYDYITITDNLDAINLVEKINNGKRIIPTILINGKPYANPGIKKLIEILEQ